MDAQLLETQVLDLASQLLTTRLEPAAAAAVGDKLAPDAVLDTPGYRARGAAAVADALALHSHLSRGAVTASEWDDGEKQATISVKLSYALPAEQLPWPLSLARHLSLPLEYHHIRVQLAADASVPTSSEASAPSKYHVARVTVPQRKQPRLLRLAERVVLAFLAPLLPLAVWLGVVAMKFLHRHPLAEGLVRAGFAAVAEIVGFVWGAAGGLLHALLPAAPAKSAQIQDEWVAGWGRADGRNTTNGTTTDVGASPTASPVRRASRLAVPTEAKESKKDKTESKDKAEPKPKAEAKPKPKSAAPKSAPAPATPAPKAAPAPSELAREEAAAEDNLAPPPLTKDEVRVAPAPAGAPSFAAAAAEAPGDRAARAEVADVAREEAAAEAGAAPHPLSKDEVVVPPAPAGAPSFAAAAAESAGSSPASASPPASVSDAPKKKKNKKKNHHTKSQL
ncbi:hypothetical protein Q8F55_001281 [Vanrija albida]|uniref:SMP-LTD domain-containing protein n=1 Tax=Vanrija albida TaxID=181172 RepID=A0ABR3QG29_9TREE